MLNHKMLAILDDPEDLLRLLVVQPRLQEALEVDREQMADLFYTAVKCVEENQFDRAIDLFTFLTTINPTIPNFWVGLGCALRGIKRYHQAQEALKFGICLGAEGTEAFVYLVQCLMEEEGREGALDVLDIALDVVEHENKNLYAELMATRNYVLSK